MHHVERYAWSTSLTEMLPHHPISINMLQKTRTVFAAGTCSDLAPRADIVLFECRGGWQRFSALEHYQLEHDIFLRALP